MLAAPGVWLLQIAVSYGFATLACYPHFSPQTTPLLERLRGIEAVIAVVALAIAIAALAQSWRLWRRTRDERPGTHHDLIEVGEGRTRFLALSGLIMSGGFLIALFLTAVETLYVGPC